MKFAMKVGTISLSSLLALLGSQSLTMASARLRDHPGFRLPCYGLGSVHSSSRAVELQRADALLQKYTTAYKKYFRFPGLCSELEDVETVEAQGYAAIGGDVYGGDGFEKNPAKIVSNILVHVRPGSIVILHMHGCPNASLGNFAARIHVRESIGLAQHVAIEGLRRIWRERLRCFDPPQWRLAASPLT